MTGLTNGYVEKLGKKYCSNFLGVFPSDFYPDTNNKSTFSIIFNESRHDEEGTHFVAIFANKHYLYYFDSLGLKLENDYILNFVKMQNRSLVENKTQIQSYESIFCGFFCLTFILYMEKFKYKNFFNHFSTKNLTVNDKIVVDFFIKLAQNKKN